MGRTLSLYQPYPTDLETWKKQQEQLKVVSFLSGLDVHYVSARNQLLSGSDLPTLNVSFSRLSRIPIAETDLPMENDNVALTTYMQSTPNSNRGKGRGRGRMGGGRGRGRTAYKRDDRTCDYCHMVILKISAGSNMGNLNG